MRVGPGAHPNPSARRHRHAGPRPDPDPRPRSRHPPPRPQPRRRPPRRPAPVAQATPEPEAEPPLAFDPLVVRGTLSNGLSYYIRHNEEPRDRARIALVVKAGSVHEEEHQRGLAHFVEHMAFNGTERFAKQEIVDYLESIGSRFGSHLNARTGFDDTLYFLEIPTDDPEITETAFRILSDWAYAISFDPDEVELERGVVLEEWRLGQGFNSRFQDSLLRALFGSTIYANRAPIGLPEVVEGATAEVLREYYERWYRPDLMAVVAVGHFDVAEMEAKRDGSTSPRRRRARQPRRRPPPDSPRKGRASRSPATPRRGSRCSPTPSRPATSSSSSASCSPRPHSARDRPSPLRR